MGILDTQEEADGRQGGGGQQQSQQSQQSQQQGQQGTTPTEASQPSGGRGAGAPNREAPRRNNIRVINFPSVQVMMTRGQPGSSQGAAGAGQSASGGANPQVPQFGAPMLFGLPL